MDDRKIWQIFPGQQWPASVIQEKLFYSEMLNSGAKKSKFDRDDASVLISALRVGCSLQKITEILPGINVGSLLGAYEKLNSGRESSLLAWAEIEADAGKALDKKIVKRVRKMFPTIGDRIDKCNGELEELKVEIELIKEKIDNVMQLASQMESILERHNPEDRVAKEIGVRLFNPYRPGVYGQSLYLPDRVSSLSPLRVRELLGKNGD